MYYDALLLLIIAYTTWRGSIRGVTWQLAGIAAIVLCFLFAAPLSIAVAPMIKLDPPLNRWVAMLSIYLAFSFGSFAAAKSIRSILETLKFQEYDRHLGAVFGFIKGAVICLVMTFFVVALSASARESVLRTTSGRLAGYLLYKASMVMPKELDGVLAPYFRKIEDELTEIAEEKERNNGDSDQSLLSFDLDPRDDADDSNRERDNNRDRDDQEDLDEDQLAEKQPKGKAKGGLLDSAASVIKDRLANGVSDFVDQLLDSDSDSESDDEGSSSSTNREEGSNSRTNVLPRRKPETEQPKQRRPAVTAADDAEVDRLLTDILQAYSPRANQREQLREEVDRFLEGVPATIARQALSDWRADVYGKPADPDPRTDIETPFRERVVRQLEKARISLNDLPGSVRDRLRKTR